MAFVFIVAGLVLLIAAVKNTQSCLFTLLKADFTGPNNFIFWALSILLIGALGYIPKLRALSVAFLTLVVIVLLLKRGNPQGVGGGFFAQLLAGLGSTTKVQSSTTQPGTSSPLITPFSNAFDFLGSQSSGVNNPFSFLGGSQPDTLSNPLGSTNTLGGVL